MTHDFLIFLISFAFEKFKRLCEIEYVDFSI